MAEMSMRILKNMNLEQRYDEKDDLECAVSLLKKASSCISKELEGVHTNISRVIETLEEEISLVDSSIKASSPFKRRGGARS